MITMPQVSAFCKQMHMTYGAMFRHQPTQNGAIITGEYHTIAGQAMTIQLNVNAQRIEVKVLDMSKRLVFSDRITDNICYNRNLLNFLQRNIQSA